MEISIRIREKLRKGLITVCLFYCGFHSALLGQSLSRSKQNNNMVTSRHYSSAFAGPQNKVVSSFSFGEYDFRDTIIHVVRYTGRSDSNRKQQNKDHPDG